MENTGKIIRDILKFYFSYILIVLIAVPAVIYLLFYLAGEYLLQDGSSLEDVLNSSMADDISRFSVKVGYELQYGAMGACEGFIKHYVKIGIGFTF